MQTTLTRADIKRQLRKLNNGLRALTYNAYFDGIPVNQLAELAGENGFDTADFEGIYTGREGRATVDLGHGASMAFTWYKMGSGRYEIVAYAT